MENAEILDDHWSSGNVASIESLINRSFQASAGLVADRVDTGLLEFTADFLPDCGSSPMSVVHSGGLSASPASQRRRLRLRLRTAQTRARGPGDLGSDQVDHLLTEFRRIRRAE